MDLLVELRVTMANKEEEGESSRLTKERQQTKNYEQLLYLAKMVNNVAENNQINLKIISDSSVLCNREAKGSG